MRIKAQISMVMNLDKCIGCHTCSITCKNTWTNRPGTEYMYFNNVETRPGMGYPKNWENQDLWRGGWELRDGRLTLRGGAPWMRLAKLFYNPQQPTVDDYYEPWTYDYDHLVSAPRSEHQPVARPRSLITGERMDIKWGPNWDDDLAGTKYARQDINLKRVNEKIEAAMLERADKSPDAVGKKIQMEMEDLFMRYLPRICNHCLNPACVAACPSGAIYKRDEDGVVLISQDTCRGWRACIPACPYKKIYFNWKTNKSEKCIFCFPRLESGLPTICAETCVGRLRYMGVLLYDADAVEACAKVERDEDTWHAIKDALLNPFDEEVIAQAKRDGITDEWLRAAQNSPVYKLICAWNLALPLHAEYRTMPMVWYIPPMSPIMNNLSDQHKLASADEMRIPVQYLAELFSAGDPEPIREIIDTLALIRRHMRTKEIGAEPIVDETQAKRLEEMYRLLAIAAYDKRFVIPTTPNASRGDSLDAQHQAGFMCHKCEGAFK